MLVLRHQLKELLKQRGLTSAALAKLAAVPKTTVSDYLAGREPRKMEHIKKLAEALDVTVDNLLFGTPIAAKEPTTVELEDLIGSGWLSGQFEIRLRRINRK